MVQRTSQELSINTGGTVGVQQSGTGFVAPDANKFATGGTFDAPLGADTSPVSRILSRLTSGGEELLGQQIKQNHDEAYLSGMAQVSTAQSEADLQATPLMKDWVTAGYRDTMGRLKAADTEAQIATDMHKMREASPEDFATYMAEKRHELTDSWQGMTLATRQAMVAQQALTERSWIKKQAVEHYKFGVETEQKVIKSTMDTSFASLQGAKGDPASYKAASEATFGTTYSAVIANPKLPNEVKGKLLSDLATRALEDDHQQLYAMLHNQPVHLPGMDGEHPMSTLISWEDDVALSKAFRASEARTEMFRNADWGDRKAKMEADWENPNTPLMPVSQVEALAQDGAQRRTMNLDQYTAFKESYYKKSEKKRVQTNLAAAYAAGDQGTMLGLDKTTDEGLTAYIAVQGRHMTVPQLADNLLTIGNTTGQDNAYKKVGELMAPAFAQLGNNDKIDPANAAAVSGVLKRIDKAEKDGRAGAYHQFLSAFDPEVQAKISYMRDNLAKGNDPTTSIAAATAQVLEESKMTPAMRAEITVSKAKDIRKEIDNFEPRGFFGTAGLYIKSLASPTQQGRDSAKASLAATPYQGWFESDDRVAEIAASSKLALVQSADEIVKNNPHLSTSSVMSMAKADVAGRSVMTGWGPLIVPKGFSVQKYFGVGQDVDSERIGKALDEFIKPKTEDGRMSFRLGVNGELMYQELNARGKPADKAHIIDPKQVAPMVETQLNRQHESFKLDHGEGVSVTKGGMTIQFNGDNTSNVDNGWMRRLRQDLVDHEGVSDKVYTDPEGNQTIGVGFLVKHSKTGMRPQTIQVGPDGKVSRAQIEETLMQQTDIAGRTATRLMSNTGMRTEAAFKFYTSLAYQSGNGFTQLKAYEPLMQSILKKDVGAATTALKASPAWKSSQPARQQYYLNNLIAAMRG